MTRRNLQKPIEILFLIAGIYLAWQAVNFCQGEAPIPLLVKPQIEPNPIAWLLQIPFYYLLGIALWVSAGSLTILVGRAFARVVAVGWSEFAKECRESWMEEQRLATIESNRQKRRELRRKLNKEKNGGDTTGAFVIGAIIGSFFF